MSILLIIYVLFIVVYLVFNAYILFRVNAMRVKNDLTSRGMIIYVIAIAIVFGVSFVIIGSLNWDKSLIGGNFAI
ncbi:TPA: hypothetical protein DD449_01890 [Candidatus Berkelbacteria bacterium]|uniref:Uncharacterized protein n=1 Tax=Berkelbacteria bacterium GW2011_GWE1_39_12 TaxID=1618337 RepID=A0A0G4B4G0_9BACT|nr:MAG: hypothetical protein UT28_C0001G0708 [Berkelbacteria bacterium GW2011_GWE1_39_12]HBO60409.1 hypothetical protein [Candidatus Berkelbacteria bacterium]